MRPLTLASTRWVMTECPFQSRLSAFHDRELDADASSRLEEHLTDCESCRQTLAGIRAVSRLLNTPVAPQLSQMGLARLHATADAAAKSNRRVVFPLARTMIAVAASVLIIAGAWLTEIPVPAIPGGSNIVRQVTPEADWEKLASGGKMDMPKEMGNDTGMASNIDWMLNGLRVDPRP